jgi:hypothetical protein
MPILEKLLPESRVFSAFLLRHLVPDLPIDHRSPSFPATFCASGRIDFVTFEKNPGEAKGRHSHTDFRVFASVTTFLSSPSRRVSVCHHVTNRFQKSRILTGLDQHHVTRHPESVFGYNTGGISRLPHAKISRTKSGTKFPIMICHHPL